MVTNDFGRSYRDELLLGRQRFRVEEDVIP